MGYTLQQGFDHVINAALPELTASARSTLDQLYDATNKRLHTPFSLSASGSVVTIGASLITDAGPATRQLGVPPLSGVDLGTLTGTFNVNTGVGTGNVLSATLPTVASGSYVKVGWQALNDKAIHSYYGDVGTISTVGAVPFSGGGLSIGESLLLSNGTTLAIQSFTQYTGAGVGGGAGTEDRQVFQFSNNASSFTLNFMPDPTKLKVFWVEKGEVLVLGAWWLNGRTVIFLADTFNEAGLQTLVFEQIYGSAFDGSPVNANLLASNFLGSSDLSVDRSSAGRGIKLRNAAGTLVELTLDASNNIVIKSV